MYRNLYIYTSYFFFSVKKEKVSMATHHELEPAAEPETGIDGC